MSELNFICFAVGDKMSITTCQKVTLISCCVLCVSLFLPRMFLPKAKKEAGRPQVGPGFYPPSRQQLSLQGDPQHWGLDTFSAVDAASRMKSVGRGKKYNLMAQAIPIYGFGILLYILYIVYKLTCKAKTKTVNYTVAPVRCVENKIPDEHEFAKLQERLIRTEMLMDRLVAKKGRSSSSGRKKKTRQRTSRKEEKLLKELQELTQRMQEGRLEGASPEMEAEEVPYGADWEGYPEETYPEHHMTPDRYGFTTLTLEDITSQPTAEALAERMEEEEEEMVMRRLSVVQEEDEGGEEENMEGPEEKQEEQVEECIEEEEDEEEEEEEAEKRLLLTSEEPPGEQERLGLVVSREMQKKQITFSDTRDVFRYPRQATLEEEEDKDEDGEEKEEGEEDEEEEEEVEEEGGTEVEDEGDEDDPVMEAERLQFSCVGPNPEEEAEEAELLTDTEDDEEKHVQEEAPKEVTGLRMRSRREK